MSYDKIVTIKIENDRIVLLSSVLRPRHYQGFHWVFKDAKGSSVSTSKDAEQVIKVLDKDTKIVVLDERTDKSEIHFPAHRRNRNDIDSNAIKTDHVDNLWHA